MAVRTVAVGDVAQLVREVREAAERLLEWRLGVGEGEGASEVEPDRQDHALALRGARLLVDRQCARGLTEERETGGEREPAAQRLDPTCRQRVLGLGEQLPALGAQADTAQRAQAVLE